MDRKRNYLTSIVLFLIPLSSCTVYKEFDTVTGNQVLAFRTNANVGITTSKIDESNSSSNGIAALSGGFTNDTLTEAKENTESNSSIQVGQLTMTGTVDHSTPMDVAGGWTWRIIRSIVTGNVLQGGIDSASN